MDVADWLRELELEEYEPAFRENNIDIALLPTLTADDLKDLGVKSVGHRRRMLDALALLRARPSPPVVSVPLSDATSATRDLPASEAERRQLTVMFCDLVGSTALSAGLDPEDMRDVIAAYHGCVAGVVRRFDGFVAKYMGDGALVYFGYPEAHEDDPERAARASLALIETVAQLCTKAGNLRVRIGVATGLVVVGGLMGAGEAQERGVVGDTPNLAARLQALAKPDTVVVAPSTRRFLGRLFEYEDLGAIALRGFAQPVQAWRVIRESAVESRFEALHSREAPLVGREEEIELLLRRWARAKVGEGQVVLLSGEPGIGKSRITAAFQARISPEPRVDLRYFCSPYHQDSALRPVIAQIERAAGFERADAPEQKSAKLQALLAPMSFSSEDLALLAELLSISSIDGCVPLDLAPQQRKERTLEALLRHLEKLAGQRPVLMIFEDVHWIDPTSREFLERAVDRVSRLPALMILTFRPEFQPPWVGTPHVSMYQLNRLSGREGASLIQSLAGKPLPSEVAEAILARTDGVPVFIEELTKAVLESGLVEEQQDRFVLSGPLPELAIPTTLQASLMARLDRLDGVKEVAQIGACIGREFSYELLAAVARRSGHALLAALGQLSGAGLIFERGRAPHASYMFKHALVQDAAYSTLLRAKRQELHARIAKALERQFSDLCETQPELLARHYQHARLPEQAIGYWQRAGDRAARRSANREAVVHFRNALELLQELPDRSAHAEQELQLLIALGPALMATRSSAAPETASVYARARELARSAERTKDLFPTVWGAWLVAFTSADFATARRLVDELFGMTTGSEDPSLLLQAHHAAWPTHMATGALAKARAHIGAGLALYRRDVHGRHALQYGGHDPGVCGYVNDALIAATLGYSDQAVRQMEEGLALARSLDHAPSVAQALWFAAELHQIRREPRQVETFVAAGLPLLLDHGSAVGVANAAMLRGWARVMQGSIEDGLATMREGLAAWRQTGSKFSVPYRLARAADAHRFAGRTEESLSLVDEAIDQSDDRWFAPELHRLKGELLLQMERREEGEEFLQNALRGAREQNARLLELRAATSLAGLWHARGQNNEANDLLGNVHAWFTEGLDTADLREARSMLKKIHQTDT